MATMINGQLILEEEYDENYQPTEQGKWNFNFAVFVMFTSKFIQGFSDWNKARNIFPNLLDTVKVTLRYWWFNFHHQF